MWKIEGGRVERVVMKKQEDFATKAPKPDAYEIYVTHSSSADSNSQIMTDTFKVKDVITGEAFKKVLGKIVSFPIVPWAMNGKTGFRIENGVLPTVHQATA